MFVCALILAISWGFTALAASYHGALVDRVDRAEALTDAAIAADDRAVVLLRDVRQAQKEVARLQEEIARLKAEQAKAETRPTSTPAPTPVAQPMVVTPVTNVRPERQVVTRPSRSTRAS